MTGRSSVVPSTGAERKEAAATGLRPDGDARAAAAGGTRRAPLPAGEERRLVRRLKAGDERAFAELVRTYQGRVFGLVYRMLGDRHEAEDVAQEVFLSVHRGIGRYRGEGRFQTWLFRIAANACRNRIRRLASRAACGAQPVDAVLETQAQSPVQQAPDGPEDATRGHRLEEAIQRELQNLSDEHRLLVVLRDIQGLSYAEIGEVTGLAEGTVKSRLHRARLALKERLRPYLS